MAHVITDRCREAKDQSCVEVCPVDCIHPTAFLDGDEPFQTTTQLYINPDTCIDCGACVPVCPVEAIFMADDLPSDQQKFVEINAAYYQ